MKKALKASHKKDVVNQQVVRIEKQVNPHPEFKKNITTWKGFVTGGKTVEIDKQWITTQFKTRVPEFYEQLMEATGKSDNFQVPAGACKRKNDMDTGEDNIADDLKKTVKITDDNPCVYFLQGNKNTCIISSLASAVRYMGDVYASDYIIQRREESLYKLEHKGRMQYCKDIIMGQFKQKGERKLNYGVEEWKEQPSYNIFTNISPYPTVCNLLDESLGTGHCVTVCNKWIFDSNFEQALPLTQNSLNFICEGKFLSVPHAIRAIPPPLVKNRLSNKN